MSLLKICWVVDWPIKEFESRIETAQLKLAFDDAKQKSIDNLHKKIKWFYGALEYCYGFITRGELKLFLYPLRNSCIAECLAWDAAADTIFEVFKGVRR